MRLSSVRINLCGPIGASTNRNGHATPNAGTSNGPSNGSPVMSPRNGETAGRLRAFCSLTFDDMFVVRDVKLIEGHEGLFLAMPSRKLCDRCRRCSEKNHLRARFCNHCGTRLDEARHTANRNGGNLRIKLHADIAHPINATFRESLERQVLAAYEEELDRSRQPGYIAPDLEHDQLEEDGNTPGMSQDLLRRLRPTVNT
jgi:DNA-binding cell septation regulator SpoVG